MRNSPTEKGLEQAISLLDAWVEKHDYKGYDPGDGLTSVFRPLTFGNLLLERILIQSIWKSPVNLRPILGVKRLPSTKGRGFMAWGYTLLYRSTAEVTWLEKAKNCLDWLDQNKEPAAPHHCWGNHFDFTTRSGRMRAHTPTIVWSGLIGQAYLEYFEQTQDQLYLDIAVSICKWILTLPREETPTGSCLSYVPTHQNSVHNSNLLGAGLLSRTFKHSADHEFLDTARSAVEYTVSRQRDDGSWWYGEEAKYRWIDNFHTAYNLDSLKRYQDNSGDNAFCKQIQVGYQYFKDTFFEESGLPRYYHDRTYPIDIQCAAQAIDTFAFFRNEDPEALELSRRVANWTINHMQDRSGYFHYRRFKALRIKTPYFHWGQATMFKALSHLTLGLSSNNPGEANRSSTQASS